MSDTLPARFNLKIEGTFKDRLQKLMDKKGIDANSIVKLAVSEMSEREFEPDASAIRTDKNRNKNSPSSKR